MAWQTMVSSHSLVLARPWTKPAPFLPHSEKNKSMSSVISHNFNAPPLATITLHTGTKTSWPRLAPNVLWCGVQPKGSGGQWEHCLGLFRFRFKSYGLTVWPLSCHPKIMNVLGLGSWDITQTLPNEGQLFPSCNPGAGTCSLSDRDLWRIPEIGAFPNLG